MWSSTYIKTYNRGIIKGIFTYLRHYSRRRLLDIFGITMYMCSIFANIFQWNKNTGYIIRTSYVLQIFQSYRILFPFMRVIHRTLFGYEKRYIIFILYLIFLYSVLSSIILYLSEVPGRNNIFQSFYLAYLTFTTIGYVESIFFWLII